MSKESLRKEMDELWEECLKKAAVANKIVKERDEAHEPVQKVSNKIRLLQSEIQLLEQKLQRPVFSQDEERNIWRELKRKYIFFPSSKAREELEELKRKMEQECKEELSKLKKELSEKEARYKELYKPYEEINRSWEEAHEAYEASMKRWKEKKDEYYEVAEAEAKEERQKAEKRRRIEELERSLEERKRRKEEEERKRKEGEEKRKRDIERAETIGESILGLLKVVTHGFTCQEIARVINEEPESVGRVLRRLENYGKIISETDISGRKEFFLVENFQLEAYLALIKKYPGIRKAEIGELLSNDGATVRRTLRILENKELITAEAEDRSGAKGYYILEKKLQQPPLLRKESISDGEKIFLTIKEKPNITIKEIHKETGIKESIIRARIAELIKEGKVGSKVIDKFGKKVYFVMST